MPVTRLVAPGPLVLSPRLHNKDLAPTKVEGRRLEFSVRAFDEVEQIGSGTHRRAVIDSAKFNDRIKSKKKN